MNPIFEVATRISLPRALAGFFAAVVFPDLQSNSKRFYSGRTYRSMGVRRSDKRQGEALLSSSVSVTLTHQSYFGRCLPSPNYCAIISHAKNYEKEVGAEPGNTR